MIITQDKPFTLDQISKLREEFDVYIKTVIDVKRKICSAGMNRHFEGEALLLAQGSKQSDIWGGGIDVITKVVDYNSFINIRTRDNNPTNDIQSEKIRKAYKQITDYFFEELNETK